MSWPGPPQSNNEAKPTRNSSAQVRAIFRRRRRRLLSERGLKLQLAADCYFAGWLAYQVATLSMSALLYIELMLCIVELSRFPSRYCLRAIMR